MNFDFIGIDKNTYGGSFLYHLNDSTNVAVGFVIGLGMCENLRQYELYAMILIYFISQTIAIRI